jgi:hypothetical protein
MDARERPSEFDSLGITTSGYYHEGEPILSWLRQAAADSATQEKKNEILSRLVAGNCDAQTRMDIGDHVHTPLEALLLLTEDEHVDVRFALAENHNIPESILNVLLEDSNPYVAHRAQKTLASLSEKALP